ncbi:MAG: GNAT family N-acetyltransferase [bacterium]|nr:GNAT family N-acetyltransferase [bacterium]
MEIIEYNFSDNYVEDYIKLIGRLYLKNYYTKTFQENVKFLLNPENPYFKYARVKNFIVYKDDDCIGHLTATIDKRLSDKIGLIGFFEAASSEAADLLLGRAIDWLKSQTVNEIRGPINLSIWHNYRFMNPVDFISRFHFEPFNLSNYPDYFKKFGFKVAENYISAFRDEFSSIITYAKPKYEDIKNSDFSIRPVDLNNFENDLKIFYRLSLIIFKNSWSFIPISFEEFSALYNKVDKIMNQRYCHFVCKDNKEIGFCFSLADPLASQKTLIMKTIGVLPEFQKNNLGSALIYLQTKNAIDDGYEKIIYALMRQNNVASNINPYGAKIFRQYESYNLFL